MIRALKLGLLPLVLAAGAMAQTTTTYTGTIKDLAQNPVTSGQVTFTLTPTTDSTVPGVGRFTPMTVPCNINGDGTLSGYVAGVVSGACVVTMNTALSPSGTSYRICIQPQFVTPGSCFYDYATTASKDITTVAPTLSTGPLNYGAPGATGATGAGYINGLTSNGTNGINVAGTVAAGTVSVTANPTTGLQLTPKQYVDCAKDQTNGLFNVACFGALTTSSDNTAAFVGALNAAIAAGGEVVVPVGVWRVNGAINAACNAIICLPSVAAGTPKAVRFRGTTRTRQDAIGIGIAGSVIQSSVVGIDNLSSIVGVPGVGGNPNGLNNVELYISDITFRTYPNPQLDCINALWAQGADIERIRCDVGESYGAGATNTQPTHLSYGVLLPGEANDTLSNLEWSQITGYSTGVWGSEHAHFDGTWVAYGLVGYEFGPGYNAITGKIGTEEVGLPVKFSGSNTPGLLGYSPTRVELDIQMEIDPTSFWGCVSWCYSNTDIQDTNTTAFGFLDIGKSLAGVGNSSNYPLSISGGNYLSFHDQYLQNWSYLVGGLSRAPVTIGSRQAANPDGMYYSVDSWSQNNDFMLGHDSTQRGVLQSYTGGVGNSVGATHGPIIINPYGGGVGIGGLINTQGFQIATGTGCTLVAGAVGNVCAATITMSPGEADTNYKITGCTISNATNSGANTVGVVAVVSAVTFNVTEVALNTTTTGGGTINCIITHN